MINKIKMPIPAPGKTTDATLGGVGVKVGVIVGVFVKVGVTVGVSVKVGEGVKVKVAVGVKVKVGVAVAGTLVGVLFGSFVGHGMTLPLLSKQGS